jgi:hypothetical protein
MHGDQGKKDELHQADDGDNSRRTKLLLVPRRMRLPLGARSRLPPKSDGREPLK